MASTFTATTTAQSQPWVVLIEIDGFGPDENKYRLCTDVPTYASTTYYLPYLNRIPELIGERLPPIGGIAERGHLTFDVVDVSALLLYNFRVVATPFAALNAAATASTTSFTVPDATLFTNNAWYYIGLECVKVTNRSGTTLTVTRAQRGTLATPHYKGAPIHAYNPILLGRQVQVKLVPRDASSSSEEKLIGTFTLKALHPTQDGRIMQFEATSDLGVLNRLVAPGQPAVVVRHHRHSGNGSWDWEPSKVGVLQWPDSVETGVDGVYIVDSSSNGIAQLGVPWAQTSPAIEAGIAGKGAFSGESGVCVYVADRSVQGSFRWSPGTNFGGTTATVRSTGTWKRTAHWIDIILSLLSSPAILPDSDTIPTDLYNTTYGNWACLPAGIGLGLKASEIDWDSFLTVRQRTQGWSFDGFFCGHETVPLSTLISEAFLEAVGAYLLTDYTTGKISIIMPRAGDAGRSADFALTTANILASPAPESTVTQPLVDLSLTCGDGYLANMHSLNAQSIEMSKYANRVGITPISVTSTAINTEVAGGEIDAMMFVGRHFSGALAGTQKIRLACTLDLWGIKPGQVGTLTCPLIPDFANGAYGVTSLRVMVSEVTISLEPCAHIILTLISFGGGTIPQYGPSAVVSSASITGGNATLTCHANYFSNAYVLDGMPVKDVSAFAVGDEVDLVSYENGTTSTASTFQTITAINAGSNTITVDGAFGLAAGAMAALVVVPAPFSSASSTQKSKVAFIGDAGDNTISGSQAVFIFGDM